MILNKIISGYHTDAERAALDFANKHMISTGGYIPKGLFSKDEVVLSKYNLQEVSTDSIQTSIEQNIINSQGTLFFFHGTMSSSTNNYKEIAKKHKKPFLHINLDEIRDLEGAKCVRRWCAENDIFELHVSGFCSSNHEIYKEVTDILDGFSFMGRKEWIDKSDGPVEIDDDLIEWMQSSAKTLDINNLYHNIKMELAGIWHYLSNLEKHIEEKHKLEYTKDGHLIVELGEDGWPEYPMDYYDWEQGIPHHLRVSFLMLLFAKFEEWMDDICDLIAHKKKVPISRRDLSGGILTSTKKYIETFGGFKEPNGEAWKIMGGLYDVRNIFVHGGGSIEKSKIKSKNNLNYLITIDAGISLHDKKLYETNRNAILSHNSKLEEECKTIVVKSVKDLRTLFEIHNRLQQVPPPIDPSAKFQERISILKDFPEFAFKNVSKFFEQLEKEHLEIFRGLRIV